MTLQLDPPTAAFFVTVANRRYGTAGERLHQAVAAEVMKAREEAQRRGIRMPSTAEFLDAVQVCRELEVDAASQTWQAITGSVLLKNDRV